MQPISVRIFVRLLICLSNASGIAKKKNSIEPLVSISYVLSNHFDMRMNLEKKLLVILYSVHYEYEICVNLCTKYQRLENSGDFKCQISTIRNFSFLSFRAYKAFGRRQAFQIDFNATFITNRQMPFKSHSILLWRRWDFPSTIHDFFHCDTIHHTYRAISPMGLGCY